MAENSNIDDIKAPLLPRWAASRNARPLSAVDLARERAGERLVRTPYNPGRGEPLARCRKICQLTEFALRSRRRSCVRPPRATSSRD